VVDQAEGAHLDFVGLLDGMRAMGLITYPSPPLLAFLEEYPGMFQAEVLPRLDPADRAVLAQVASPLLAAVVAAAAAPGASALSRAGKSAGVPLKLVDFVGSTERLAWARENGCPSGARTCLCRSGGAVVCAGAGAFCKRLFRQSLFIPALSTRHSSRYATQ